MKSAIRYLRFSHSGQSAHSIERQDIITADWCKYHTIQCIDTFIDEGYSARNFDRPDITALFAFIKKNSGKIDYLVVAELTRFSRQLGDAVNMVERIQKQYGIRIVSASRGAIYDCYDHNSFFMLSLEFAQGHSENIKRQNDINGGIYAAKMAGRWVQGGPAPFGYKKEGHGKDRHLVIDPVQAAIIRFIYDAYLKNTPIYAIRDDAKAMGMPRTSHSIVQTILTNPLYMGMLQVKAWKDKPATMVKGIHEAIIDPITWHRVQDKINNKPSTRVSIADATPLRGVLKCHCGKLLTAAPSRSRNGNYYYYYKCQLPRHNNISATAAHSQLQQILELFSLPTSTINRIRMVSKEVMTQKTKDDQKIILQKQTELSNLRRQMESIEEKYINNQMEFATYTKWHSNLSRQQQALQIEIDHLRRSKDELYLLLEKNIEKMADMRSLYSMCNTLQKQELLRAVFDNSLSWENGHYRTAWIMPIFLHNKQLFNHIQLSQQPTIAEKTDDVEATSLLSNHLTAFLRIIDAVKVA